MPTLRPYRDYDEKDVINMYAVSGAVVDSTYNIIATKGTFVKIAGPGFQCDAEPVEMLGNFGTFSVNNFVSQRYGAVPKVSVAGATDTGVIGMCLFDTRELDENQLPLKYNPRKAAEMEACISGQAVPIVTRGTFLYSGVNVGGGVACTAGNKAYLAANGEISTSGTVVIGKFLGSTGVAGTGLYNGSDLSKTALVWINIQ